MSDKTKAQLQAELKAAKETISALKAESANFEEVANRALNISLGKDATIKELATERDNLKSINQQQALEIQDLHEGLKMLQDQLAVARAEKGEEEKAKLRAIEEVEDCKAMYHEKSIWDCIKEALA